MSGSVKSYPWGRSAGGTARPEGSGTTWGLAPPWPKGHVLCVIARPCIAVSSVWPSALPHRHGRRGAVLDEAFAEVVVIVGIEGEHPDGGAVALVPDREAVVAGQHPAVPVAV